MIGPFDGPHLIDVPHARLLYCESEEVKNMWSNWPQKLSQIDELLEADPRHNLASNDVYLYFFGEDAPAAWLGREIIGHSTRYPEGMKTFDSYTGSVFEWRMPVGKALALSADEVFQVERRLRTLASGALSPTWRVKISNVEPWSGAEEALDVSFQFYKLV